MLMKRPMLSPRLLGFRAETRATGMPMSQESITDRTAISAVRGPRRRIMSATLSDRKNEWPKLPVNTSRIQCAYCTSKGSLRPRSAM